MLFIVQGPRAQRIRPGLEILRRVSTGNRSTKTFKIRFEGPTARPTYTHNNSTVLGCHLAVVEADSPEEAIRQMEKGAPIYHYWGGFMNLPEGWYPMEFRPSGGSFPKGNEPVPL